MRTFQQNKLTPFHPKSFTRRHFLQGIATTSIALLAYPSKQAKAAFTGYGNKSLALEHHHTGEFLDITYYANGQYVDGALAEINHFLRDYHTDETHSIDPFLLDQLYDVKLLLGTSKPFHVVSGYRSPETNASLRRHSRGVAKQSLHMEGKAVDIRVEGMTARTIRDAGLYLHRGGVGFYPSQNFVHLDTGDIRTWHR